MEKQERQEKMEPAVITVKQFCGKYQMSHSGFYAMRAQGKGPATLKMGRKRLISLVAIQEWLDSIADNNNKKEKTHGYK